MHDLVGGRYRLDEHIGNGGMAEVWRATDSRTGETVALKRLHPRLAHDPVSRARFDREIVTARAVDHPAAVRVLDAGDGPDGAWLAMEYLAGGSLAARLREGALPPAAVAAIGADVAGALAAVHAARLVHRDVKPSNILMDTDGGARLGDFGIARGEASDDVEDVTATGDVVGTLRFLPPEVLAGGSATAASDVWALGAVLYEALTGRPPFDASSPAALVASQQSMPVWPTPVGDALGDELEAMLDPDPLARPTAADAARRLRAVGRRPVDPGEDGEDATVVVPARVLPVATLPRSAATPPPSTPTARRGMVPAAVLVALLFAAGVLLAVNGPFVGMPPDEPSGAGAEAAGTASPIITPEPSPTAAAIEPARTPSDKGGKDKGKGNDKPDKPGKGNGG